MPKWLHPKKGINSSHPNVPLWAKEGVPNSSEVYLSSNLEPIIGSIQKHVKRSIWNRVDGWINRQAQHAIQSVGEWFGISTPDESIQTRKKHQEEENPVLQITPPTPPSTKHTTRRQTNNNNTRNRAQSSPSVVSNNNQAIDNPVRMRAYSNNEHKPPRPIKRRRSSTVTGQDHEPNIMAPNLPLHYGDPRFATTLYDNCVVSGATPPVSFSSFSSVVSPWTPGVVGHNNNNDICNAYVNYPLYMYPPLAAYESLLAMTTTTGLSVDVPTVRDPFPSLPCPPFAIASSLENVSTTDDPVVFPPSSDALMMSHIPLGCDKDSSSAVEMVVD